MTVWEEPATDEKKMPPEFGKETVRIVAERAAWRCSNPDCDKLTVGPNPDHKKSTRIGQAAHIYGAKPNAERYRAEMTDKERSSISNAIWLCSDCHILIDREASRHPDDLLFLWRSTHEAKILLERGKPGELVRLEYAKRQLREFEHLSLFAQQLIKDRPDYWEFLLTLEVLDTLLKPVLRRSEDLAKGLYTRRVYQPERSAFMDWSGVKISEVIGITQALGKLINDHLTPAWGPPGKPGDPHEIVHVCGLIADCANRLVEWQEDLSFIRPPEGFEPYLAHLAQAGTYPLRKVPEISDFIRSIFKDGDPKPGTYAHTIMIDIPDSWTEKIESLLQQGEAALMARDGAW